MGPIVDQSQTTLDALTGTGMCGASKNAVLAGQQARCGVGPRQPLLVISPFSRENFVDNTLTEQSSVVRFIEDNWRLGSLGGGSFDSLSGSLNGMFDFARPRAERVFLDPTTGQPVDRD
jgi:phospholipase C